MTTSRLRVMLAVILVFSGVASASAMVMPCHDMRVSAQVEARQSDHAEHAMHHHDSAQPGAVQLPCDGACCDGLACPGHAASVIFPQPTALRIAALGPVLLEQRLTNPDPVLRPLIPPYRPPAS